MLFNPKQVETNHHRRNKRKMSIHCSSIGRQWKHYEGCVVWMCPRNQLSSVGRHTQHPYTSPQGYFGSLCHETLRIMGPRHMFSSHFGVY